VTVLAVKGDICKLFQILLFKDFKENDHFFKFGGHVSTELLSSSVEWVIAGRVE